MTVNPFSDAQLQSIITETIPSTLPAGHTSAIVGSVDQNGAQVVASFELGDKDEWQFQAAAQHTWTGDNEVGARVILSW